METRYRKADPGDAAELASLYSQLDPDAAPAPERIAVLLRRLTLYPSYSVWLAEVDGRIRGTLALLIMDTLGTRCVPAAIVEDVVVDEVMRGEGIGRGLLELAMEKAAEAGCYKLVLSSNSRRTEAHRFYETLGFERHGISFAVAIKPAAQ